MAPVTRSSVHGRRGQAMQPLPPMDIDDDEPQESIHSEDDPFREDLTDMGDGSPFRSAKDILLPLQETANRVSRQVEDFAKALDKFKSERDPTDQELWVEAFGLLHTYRDITEKRVQQTSTRNRNSIGDDRVQHDNLQLERNLWILTENLLICKCPEALTGATDCQETALQDLTRYTSNWDLWNTFLNSDTVAQEYECSLDWLQENLSQSAPSLEEVVREKVKESDRGDGIWSAGLIYTKDAIKKIKRTRALAGPLDISPSDIPAGLRQRDGMNLVSQMDPDAPTREKSNLADADEHHEDAAWEICWEMLRRGMKLSEIRAWWSDRKESWRTALIQGSYQPNDDSALSPWLRIMNIATNPQWFTRCERLSDNNTGHTNFELGVYGVLSGNHEATAAACDDLDDIFFSCFNAMLVRRYSEYLAAYQHKLKDPSITGWEPGPSSVSQIREIVATAESDEAFREELQRPNKLIQAALLSQNFEEFFVQQGEAAAHVAHLTQQASHLIEQDDGTTRNDLAQIAAGDQDAVRIVAHLQLLLRKLALLDRAYGAYPYQMDNNIVNYIGFLERESKFGLIPLYAAALEPERTAHVLGTVLIEVTDPRERDVQVRLLQQYGIDVPTVLYGIFQLANYEQLQELKTLDDASRAAKITTYVETGSVRYIKMIPDFMGPELVPNSQEERTVQSVQWMKYMDATHWEMAALAVTSVYKFFLLTGKLAAAKELSHSVNLAVTSFSAIGMNLSLGGLTDEESTNGEAGLDGSSISIEDRVQPVSPTRRRKTSRAGSLHLLSKQSSNREELVAQSLVWAQLEQLVTAMESLESWQALALEIEGIRGDVMQMRAVKRELQDALHELQESMFPLLESDYLTLPVDELERAQLRAIRNFYIPEMILAYNSALYFAGHSLSRSYLVQCMDLAQEVAQNDMVTNTFVESGRMRELVCAFALDSQALLRANEVGSKSSSTKKGKRDSINSDGNSDIWQVTWKEDLSLGTQAVE